MGEPAPGEEPSAFLRSYSAMDAALDEAIAPFRTGDAPLAVLFSGGVDSGLLAWELRRRPAVRLVTVGVAGSADLEAAARAATVLGLPSDRVELSEIEVRTAADRASAESRDLPRVARHVLVAFGAALERAPAPSVLCGQGADELFLGYAHFRSLSERAALERSEADLHTLLERDWPRAQALAARNGRRVFAPYLHPGFVAAARAIPIGWRLPGDESKSYFRRWAEHRGLPHAIARRPKRALQYGSGVDRILARWERSDGP